MSIIYRLDRTLHWLCYGSNQLISKTTSPICQNPVENDLSVLLNKDSTGNTPDGGCVLIYFQGNISNVMFAVWTSGQKINRHNKCRNDAYSPNPPTKYMLWFGRKF